MRYSKLLFAPLIAATLALAGCGGEEPPVEEAPLAEDEAVGEAPVAEEEVGLDEGLEGEDELTMDIAAVGFGDLDADATGDLTMEEFDEFGEGIFNEWDVDADAELTAEEFPDEFEEAGYWEEWDLNNDAVLDEAEFEEGLFGLFDENDDDLIAEDEFNTVYNEWDWGF